MTIAGTPLLERPPTINPYRHAAGELWRRLRWDLHPQSWSSRSRLRLWRNRHDGDSAVILCNGPSLLQCDLSTLGGVSTFGLNKINLLFDRTSFRPSYIVSMNPFVNEQNAVYLNETAIPLFVSSSAIRVVKPRPSVTYLYPAGQQQFARDCSLAVFEGYTVTYVALQLAYHMGFRRVALVGCDHRFAQRGPANATVVAGRKDESHFDPRYFSGGMQWQLPDLLQSEVSYTMAREVFEGTGREIYNCTVGGDLEVFRRMPLEQFLHGRESL